MRIQSAAWHTLPRVLAVSTSAAIKLPFTHLLVSACTCSFWMSTHQQLREEIFLQITERTMTLCTQTGRGFEIFKSVGPARKVKTGGSFWRRPKQSQGHCGRQSMARHSHWDFSWPCSDPLQWSTDKNYYSGRKNPYLLSSIFHQVNGS